MLNVTALQNSQVDTKLGMGTTVLSPCTEKLQFDHCGTGLILIFVPPPVFHFEVMFTCLMIVMYHQQASLSQPQSTC